MRTARQVLYAGLKQQIASWVYRLRGSQPWTRGYIAHRNQLIARVLQDEKLLAVFSSDESLPTGYGARMDERVVEYPWLFARLSTQPALLLDAGSTLNQRYLLDQPQLASKTTFIYTLAPEGTVARQQVSYIYGDLRNTVFKSGLFDAIVCISTLEHIGMDNTMRYSTDLHHREYDTDGFRAALRELNRLLRPGGVLYLTVPYGVYEQFGWLQQFDAALLNAAKDEFAGVVAEESYFRYSAHGWQRADAAECAACRYHNFHTLRTPSDDHAAAARAVACLVLQKDRS